MVFSFRSVSRRRMAGVLAFCVLASACLASQAARLDKPSPNDHYVAKSVASLLKHRSPSPPTAGRRDLRALLQDVSQGTRPDEDVLLPERLRRVRPEQGQAGGNDRKTAISASPTWSTIRFLARIDERVKMIDQILASKQDFSLDEEMVVDKDALQYAKTPDEAYDRWRKRIKYDLLLLKADKAEARPTRPIPATARPRAAALEALPQVRQDDAADRATEELLEMYLTSLTTAFDPHTTYMSPEIGEELRDHDAVEARGHRGLAARASTATRSSRRSSPAGPPKRKATSSSRTRSSASARARSGELVDVVDMKLNDVVKMIRGKPGTVVRLQVTSLKDPKPHVDQDHARRDRIEGQRGPGRSLRGRSRQRRQALQASA